MGALLGVLCRSARVPTFATFSGHDPRCGMARYAASVSGAAHG